MIYYSKITAKKNIEDIRQIFLSCGADDDNMILDTSVVQKQEGSIFRQMKQRLVDNDEQLSIDTLRSLGKNYREIAKELQWFCENNVSLIVLDLPATNKELADPKQLLLEVFVQLAAVETNNVKAKQAEGIRKSKEEKKPFGRKKIPYPANWDQLYNQWKWKEITITEFMMLTGLKKGTIYNLIKQYKGEESSTISKEA